MFPRCSKVFFWFPTSSKGRTADLRAYDRNWGSISTVATWIKVMGCSETLPWQGSKKHILPKGKFGKSSTQKCQKVGDMMICNRSRRVICFFKWPLEGSVWQKKRSLTGPWDWYIYLHEWLIFGVIVGKNISHMDPTGSIWMQTTTLLQKKHHSLHATNATNLSTYPTESKISLHFSTHQHFLHPNPTTVHPPARHGVRPRLPNGPLSCIHNLWEIGSMAMWRRRDLVVQLVLHDGWVGGWTNPFEQYIYMRVVLNSFTRKRTSSLKK